MGWPAEDGNESDYEEPGSAVKSEPAPSADAAAVDSASASHPAKSTEGKRRKRTAQEKAAKTITDPEEVKKRCTRCVIREAKKGKPFDEIYAHIEKKYGTEAISCEEAEEIYRVRMAKVADSAAPPPSGEEAAAPSAATTPTETPTRKKRRRRSFKDAGEGGSSRKRKSIGRPPDEAKQKTIVATVENNPSISLRTVAQSLDCSKSQVARVLSMNGFQRPKGRVGEWQRIPIEEDQASKQEAATTKDSEAPSSSSPSSSSADQKTEEKPRKEKKSRVKETKEAKGEVRTRELEEEPSSAEDGKAPERPSKKKKRTKEE